MSDFGAWQERLMRERKARVLRDEDMKEPSLRVFSGGPGRRESEEEIRELAKEKMRCLKISVQKMTVAGSLPKILVSNLPVNVSEVLQ